ncbi:hypothetical protein LJC17_03190 [Acholeplasma sp. OttesenSCG-928-E16]|nr:hypothetical protein [Acholeplasma sp. OttesenSCG-928-E16]
MRVLFAIVDRKLTDAATAIFHQETDGFCLELWGKGTASSEMVDLLGLGSPDKTVIIGTCKNSEIEHIFKRYKEELFFSKKGTGVAFSVPINSIGKSSLDYIEHKFKEIKTLMEENKDGK